MGLKYNCQFYGTFGTLWDVQIYDSSFSGASTRIKLADPGFTLEYQGQGKEIYDPIKGSDLKIHLMIEDNATGTALLTWLQGTVLTTNEDRFTAALYKDGDLEWYGVILPDLSGMQDASKPFEFVLTATDGLARLKGFTLDWAITTNNIVPFTEILYNILKKTPLYLSSSEDSLFSTCVDWWEDQMPAKAPDYDPLYYTEVHTLTFADKNSKGQFEPKTYYEVLEIICKHWGMRVLMSGGVYKFIQMGTYEDNGAAQYERYYKRTDGLFLTSLDAPLSIPINVSTGSTPRVEAGNQWNYYPPVKNVYLTMPFQNKNFLNGEGSFPYSDSILWQIAGGSQTLKLSIGILYNLTNVFGSSSTLSPYKFTFKIKIQLDSSQWASKSATGTNISWSSSTDYIYHTVYVSQQQGLINLEGITPLIPAGSYSHLYFSIELDGGVVYTRTGSTITPQSIKRVVGSSSLTFNSASESESIIKYVAANSSLLAPINSYDITEPDAIMGDMSFDLTPNRASGVYGTYYVNTGSTRVASGGKWRVNDTGVNYYPINILRVRDILAAQAVATPKYQGAIVGGATIEAHKSFSYSGFIYVINGAVLKGIPEQWDGEWVQVDYVHANVISDDPETTGGESGQDLVRMIGGVRSDVDFANERLMHNAGLIESIASDTTGIGSNGVIIFTNGVNYTLPAPSDWVYYGWSSEIMFKNATTGVGADVTLLGNIDGVDGLTIKKHEAYVLVSDGSNIWVKSYYKP